MKIGKITLDDEINRSISNIVSHGLSSVVSSESDSAIIRIKGPVV